jgi:glucokinase
MTDVYNDRRIVMTLDAGGTNFVFSALGRGEEIVSPISLPSHADDLQKSLKAIIKGFRQVRDDLDENPAAISFAFPGPADYPNGIIDNVGNLPAYAGGVALGPMLEDQFEIPVFINNDGDLFSYGEAVGGLLKEINHKLQKNNIPKQYKNLFGVTIGTGFGGGLVINGELSSGDNSASGEIWTSRNFDDTRLTAEEGISIRAIQRTYRQEDSGSDEKLSPKDIYDVAKGSKAGNRKAAVKAFEKMGTILGESLANAVTLIDGIIVIGGGISAAHDLFLPSAVKQLNGTIDGADGKRFSRLVSKVYNLEDEDSANEFYSVNAKEITVPFSDDKITYVPENRLAVGTSRLGTSNATALGAYAFALRQLDRK